MKYILRGLGVLVALVFLLVGTHFALIELGREVVTLRTQSEDGAWKETRLWAVDYDDDVWLHSTGARWEKTFAANPTVELVRNGATAKYVATPDRSKHEEIDILLRKKYGIADRWVRLLAPCDASVLPVRLHKEGA